MSKLKLIWNFNIPILCFLFGVTFLWVYFFGKHSNQDWLLYGIMFFVIGAIWFKVLYKGYKLMKAEEKGTVSKKAQKTDSVNGSDNFKKNNKLKKPINKKYFFVIISIVVIILAGVVFYFVNKSLVNLPAPPDEPLIIDDLPVWLLKGGEVAVYREIRADKNGVSQQIVVSNLTSKEQGQVQIYETIPKEIASKASDLEFTVQPQIIKDDPVVLWSVEKLPKGDSVDLGFSVKKSFTQGAYDIRDFWSKCLRPDLKGMERFEAEEKAVQDAMKALDINDNQTKKNLITSCLRWWRAKYEKAQQGAQELQDEKDKVAQVIQPGTTQYENIRQQAKIVIAQQAPVATANAFPRTAFFSQDIFPSSLKGLPLTKVLTTPNDNTECYQHLGRTKFLSGAYQQGREAIVVAINQFQDETAALGVPQKCVDIINDRQSTPISLEKKNSVGGYPFWVGKVVYQGQSVVATSFSVVADSVISVVIVKNEVSPEADFREITSQIVNRINIGCGGDSDCVNWICENCVAGRKICSQGECVACTYDDHCKNGYECKDNQCKAKSVAEITPPPTQSQTSQPACGQINLSQNYSLYTYTKQAAPCPAYQKEISANQLSLRCSNSAGQWRSYWVKQIEVGDTSKIKIKANLGLTDHEGFFTSECSGQGVKSDDYVDLIVLSSDPRQTLGLECNRSVSESDWSKCAVANSGTNVLAHCGVAKCSTSRQCDFEVSTAGRDFVYLVFRVGDAWLADVEGRLSNLNVCSLP